MKNEEKENVRAQLLSLYDGDEIKVESAIRYPLYEDMNDLEVIQSNYKRIGFVEGARWKDEQLEAEKEALIDKACEWLKENVSKHIHGPAYMFYKESMIEEFKQAMEGGKK